MACPSHPILVARPHTLLPALHCQQQLVYFIARPHTPVPAWLPPLIPRRFLRRWGRRACTWKTSAGESTLLHLTFLDQSAFI